MIAATPNSNGLPPRQSPIPDPKASGGMVFEMGVGAFVEGVGSTLTLADFLLARIAEDETDYLAQDGPVPDHALFLHTWECGIGAAYDNYCDCDAQARWLAESAAKRRIVAYVRTFQGALEAMDAEAGRSERRWQLEAQVLGTLALPYADHPDYREEWRP